MAFSNLTVYTNSNCENTRKLTVQSISGAHLCRRLGYYACKNKNRKYWSGLCCGRKFSKNRRDFMSYKMSKKKKLSNEEKLSSIIGDINAFTNKDRGKYYMYS